MGRKDSLTKEYMKDNHIFADAFNLCLYQGKPIIQPEHLHAMDSTEITVPYGMDGVIIPVQKYRDLLKGLSLKYDDNAIYILLGIENQSFVHYSMPVKNMVYDALQYANQVAEAGKSHKHASQGDSHVSSSEYLSGFHKTDTLIPVITLVIFWGSDPWDGPTCLHDMFSTTDPVILSHVPNYRLNLIAPAHMTNNEINRLKTELRELLLFIKYSKDKAGLTHLLATDDAFKHLDRQTIQLINELTNSDFKVEEGKEESNMCIALDEIRADAREEGKLEGRLEGQSNLVQSMFESNLLSIEQIAMIANISVEEVLTLTQSIS